MMAAGERSFDESVSFDEYLYLNPARNWRFRWNNPSGSAQAIGRSPGPFT